MPNRAKDWLAQAEHDLEQSEASRRDGRHEWACFAAQQAAEKAVKAVHAHRSQDMLGHGIVELLNALGVPLPATLADKARVLDNLYIPTRYPNGHPSGAPHEHYGPIQSEQAYGFAHEIIDYARAQMAQPRDG